MNFFRSQLKLFRRQHPLMRVITIASWFCIVLLIVAEFSSVWARVGGGQSYSGGSRGGSRGGSGGGGGGAGLFYLVIQIFRLLFWLTIYHPVIGIPLDLLLIAAVVYYFRRPKKVDAAACSSPASGVAQAFDSSYSAPVDRNTITQAFNQLRRFDPNFSEIIFTDFCYALYAKAHNARSKTNTLDQLSPYLSDAARASLQQRNPANLQAVTGIIVGAMNVVDVRGLASPLINISIEFESNYTEVVGGNGSASSEMSYYVRERWELERKRDVLSPTPAQAVALHCPRCGAPLEKDTAGACAFCGSKIESGEFQWYVRAVALLSSEARGPLLTSNVEEVGTDYATVVQPGFQNIAANFQSTHPEFNWAEFNARAALIFNELQAAWSTLDWERARPHETDNIFGMHRYWIDAYQRQGLRNVLDQCAITNMQPVKIKEDAFYNAITLRIFAQGYDFTVDQAGRVVSGSNNSLRRWSEYWTFIRNREAKPAHARADLNCPNCGAPLKVSATGICEFCGGKISSGEFDWVLSKIEQDESYAG
jgi:hypothetical protein